jgi:hypothetical protein
MQRSTVVVMHRMSLLLCVVALAMPTGVSAKCKMGSAITPGDHEDSLELDGITHDLTLHVPPSYDGTKAVPLVVDLHKALVTVEPPQQHMRVDEQACHQLPQASSELSSSGSKKARVTRARPFIEPNFRRTRVFRIASSRATG